MTLLHSNQAFVVRAGEPGNGSQSLDLLFERMGLPRENPLGAILRPGQRVVVKPNLVFDRHYRGRNVGTLITSPLLIRAVCDRVFEAVGREGEIILGDAPIQTCDWDRLVTETGLVRWPLKYATRGYWLTLADFRKFSSTDPKRLRQSPVTRRGDPNGYRAVNLGSDSLHAGREHSGYEVTGDDPEARLSDHTASNHEYLISASVLSADALVSLPKLEAPRKSGPGCTLKNLLGISGSNGWLPRHAAGNKEETNGGQCREGSWRDNDNFWRTVVDLNRIAVYADKHGAMRSDPQRSILTVVDAMIDSESEGPMAPNPAHAGYLLGGLNPVAVEVAVTRLTEWPEEQLRHLRGVFGMDRFPLTAFPQGGVEVSSFPLPLPALSRFLRPLPGHAIPFRNSKPSSVEVTV